MIRFWSLSEPNNLPEERSNRRYIHIPSHVTFFSPRRLPSTLPNQFLLDTSKKMNKDSFQTKSKTACCSSEAVTPPCGEVEVRLYYNSYTDVQNSLVFYNVIPFICLHRGNYFFYLLAYLQGCQYAESATVQSFSPVGPQVSLLRTLQHMNPCCYKDLNPYL